MFILYPSNQLEDLSFLLQKLLQADPLSVLESDQILVESQGMQHWLNMQLATHQSIAMNLSFPMPSRFIWDMSRELLGNDMIPRQSPYRREVLAFRIDDILQTSSWQKNPAAQKVTQYWQEAETGRGNALKRFQLAAAVADLFEQYMLYRPDWLFLWQQGEFATDSMDEHWQSELWRLLVAEQAWHPVALQDQAIEAITQKRHLLPKRLIIFAVNSMPPKTLEFFSELANVIDIHVFHLNPCHTFWGDISSDKARARALKQTDMTAWGFIDKPIGNPLLANLGGQGRAFFNSLQEIETFEISAFSEPATNDSGQAENKKLLMHLQNDILTLHDRREQPIEITPNDGSVYCVNGHSALREIQHLHDYLLQRFEQDPSLTPADVIVMCPAIEDYAPYIDAVFRRPYDSFNATAARLPCSVADRRLSDAEPLINSFMDLLTLPDSRFEVSKIINYLRLPAVQDKFNLPDKEIELIEWWLSEAHVHWGLDQNHKRQYVEQGNQIYTWLWGLRRLILGFAWGENTCVTQEIAYMPHVEGQQALLLGRLCHLLDELARTSKQLKKPRTAEHWQVFLNQLCETFFARHSDEENAMLMIENAISSLSEQALQANYQTEIPLEVARFHLQRSFSSADSKSQFLTGQVTFCSMIPMRSIPFKIIAILGLNEGQFPRTETPYSFDLMAQSKGRSGDRSRRSDDRYLFLEALISARDTLYLSYQGRDIRSNESREPSLVLKEVLNYIDKSYGESALSVEQLSLHPFDVSNFTAQSPGYDADWARLANISCAAEKIPVSELPQANTETGASSQLDCSDLKRFFKDPLKVYYRQVLGLRFDIEQVYHSDSEPFALDSLSHYQLRTELTKIKLEHREDDEKHLLEQIRFSGALPDTPEADTILGEVNELAGLFENALNAFAEREFKTLVSSDLKGSLRILSAAYCYKNLVFQYRTGIDGLSDHLQLWLTHLVANSVQPSPTFGIYLNSSKKKLRYKHFLAMDTETARLALSAIAEVYFSALKRPLVMPITLVNEYYKALENGSDEQVVKQSLWRQKCLEVLKDDAYFKHLQSTVEVDFEFARVTAEKLYQPLFDALKIGMLPQNSIAQDEESASE